MSWGARLRSCCLVSGDYESAAGVRARCLLTDSRASTSFRHRRRRGIASLVETSTSINHADVVYVMDLTLWSGVTASRALRGVSVMVDFGDAIYALSSYRGESPLVRETKGWLERWAIERADLVVVRKLYHREWLLLQSSQYSRPVFVVPNGADHSVFYPGAKDESLLRQLNIGRSQLVISLVGSINWSRRLRWAYGVDLIEAVALLGDLDVVGLIVGADTGYRISSN
jgi:glycosyltransferase involved in cell wall biosynthesis